MKLSDLVKELSNIESMGSNVAAAKTIIRHVSNDSREVTEGSVFVAIEGFEMDGHKFIGSAIKQGAAAVIAASRDSVDAKYQDSCIFVGDSRRALAELSCALYDHPTKELCLIGITGTNGKTTTAHLVFELLNRNQRKVAIMSTIERRHMSFQKDMDHTTMESHEIQKFAKEALDAGAEYLVLEVSSHALSLDRVYGCHFDKVLFTNFDIDHQDFYHGIDPYFDAKADLFVRYPNKFPKKQSTAIFNQDDERVKQLVPKCTAARKVTFGLGENANYSGATLKVTDSGIVGEIVGEGHSIVMESSLTTNFNCYNLLAATVCGVELGLSSAEVEKAVSKIKQIRGRLTEIESKLPFRVFIDFAHSGTALESVLSALRDISKGRIIVVFGAGGEKDPLRREAMGEAAASLADIAIVTCDNPRRESPREIIDAIVESWRVAVRERRLEREMLVEADRNLAIKKAIEWAQPDDIVCIAGKGHERGQIIGTEVFEFDDYEVAMKHIQEAENVQSRTNC